MISNTEQREAVLERLDPDYNRPMSQSNCRRLPVLVSVAVIGASLAQAQPAPRALTAADYARAEKFMGYSTNPLVYHAVRPVWSSSDLLWYRDTGVDGSRFVVFDAAKLSKEPAFDHVRLAAALSAAAGKTYEANKLPFNTIELSADGASVSFGVAGKRYQCDRRGNKCAVDSQAGAGGGRFRADSQSPDKKKTAFIREYNLWVRDIASGKETQLTTDGVKDNSYALDNAGWTRATGRCCCGRRIRRRLLRSSRISVRSARCTWWRRK